MFDLGFNNGWGDAAYDMGVDPTFDGISHTSSTLIIDWFASGAGWQGGIDESWAIDNVEVILNSTTPIPEPSTYLLFGIGTLSIFVISHQRRNKAA